MKSDNLMEHPEGGRFKEVFRSAEIVTAEKGERCALTHIYFSLDEKEVSRFHKVSSDEVWNLYDGEGVVLYTWDETSGSLPEKTILSKKENRFCHVVPAGLWQAAAPLSGTVLVGCSVGPGFEFEDFLLIDPDSKEAREILQMNPDMGPFVP